MSTSSFRRIHRRCVQLGVARGVYGAAPLPLREFAMECALRNPNVLAPAARAICNADDVAAQEVICEQAIVWLREKGVGDFSGGLRERTRRLEREDDRSRSFDLNTNGPGHASNQGVE